MEEEGEERRAKGGGWRVEGVVGSHLWAAAA